MHEPAFRGAGCFSVRSVLWARRVVAITVLWGALAGCGGSGDGPSANATRFDVSGEVPSVLLGRMDAVWIGLRSGRHDERDAVVVSRDDGRTWETAELPGRPQVLRLMHRPENVPVGPQLAAVVGWDPRSASPDWPIAKSEFFVWTTLDGVTWDVDVLGTAGGIVGDPTVAVVGPVLVASTSSVEGFNMFTSRDRGDSWQPAVLSGLAGVAGEGTALLWASADGEVLELALGVINQPVERRQLLTSTDLGRTWSATPCGADACAPPGQADGLLLRHREVSTDGGATWDAVTVEPTMPGDGPPSVSDAVEVPGGWLARATTSEASDIDHAQLVRSEDGRTWRQMLPADPCPGRSGRPNSQVSRPVLLDGRRFVVYGCSDLMFPELAVVYVGNADADEFRRVDGSVRESVVFGTPIEDGDRLILPEYGRGDDELVGVTVIG